MKSKRFIPFLIFFLDMMSVVQPGYTTPYYSTDNILKNMIPASADIGDSVSLYCINGLKDLGIQWYRSNQTQDEEINSKPGSRFMMTSMKFQSLKSRQYPYQFCSILEPVVGEKTADCTTSVLTISNITEEDYNTTYKCKWYSQDGWRSTWKERQGKIVNSEEGTRDSFTSYYSDNPLHCASNLNISWYISHDNQTLTNIDEPEKLPEQWVSERLYKQISWHNGSLYESVLTVNDDAIRIFQDTHFYCGTGVNSTIFVKSFRKRDRDRLEDVWYKISDADRYIWKVALVLLALILSAAIMALIRAGLLKICYNHCCIKLSVLIAHQRYKQSTPQSFVYSQFVEPGSTAQPPSNVLAEELTSQSQISAVLDLDEEVNADS